MLAAAGPGEGTCGAWQQLDCRCTLRLAHGIRRCMQEQQQLLQTSMCPHLPAVAGAVTGPQAELPAPSTTASAAAPSSCGRCCFGYTGAGVLLLDPAQGHLLLVCDHTESFNDCGGQIADAFKAQACAMLAPPAPPSQQQQPCNGCTSSQSACAAAAAGAAADAAAGCSTAVKPQQHQEQEALFQEPGASSVGISSSSRLAASDPSSLVSKATAATASQELLEETRGLVALPPAMLVRSQCGHVDMQNPNAPPWCPHHYRCYVLALPYVGNLCSSGYRCKSNASATVACGHARLRNVLATMALGQRTAVPSSMNGNQKQACEPHTASHS